MAPYRLYSSYTAIVQPHLLAHGLHEGARDHVQQCQDAERHEEHEEQAEPRCDGRKSRGNLEKPPKTSKKNQENRGKTRKIHKNPRENASKTMENWRTTPPKCLRRARGARG